MKNGFFTRLGRDFSKHRWLYIMFIPVFLYFVIFAYIPMGGIIMAFQDFNIRKGFFGSEFVGWENFKTFFEDPFCWRIVRNTFLMNVYDVLWAFPTPIILALLLNEVYHKHFKSWIQTLTYLPHFISLVVMCGMVKEFVSTDGLINDLIAFFGGDREALLTFPEYFRTIFISSNIWQNVGFSSIMYIAAIAGIDPTLYEAAAIDGASRFHRLLHITIPSIMGTVIIMFILRLGSMMSVGYEKIILLYGPQTYETADVISSYVYRMGIKGNDYSYATAIGLFNAVINTALLVSANKISRKFGRRGLW